MVRIADTLGAALDSPNALATYLSTHTAPLADFSHKEQLQMLCGLSAAHPDWDTERSLVFLGRTLCAPERYEHLRGLAKDQYVKLIDTLMGTLSPADREFCCGVKKNGGHCGCKPQHGHLWCPKHLKTQGASRLTKPAGTRNTHLPSDVCLLCSRTAAQHNNDEPVDLSWVSCRFCPATARESCVAALLPLADTREDEQLYCCSVCAFAGRKRLALLLDGQQDADDNLTAPDYFELPVDPKLLSAKLREAMQEASREDAPRDEPPVPATAPPAAGAVPPAAPAPAAQASATFTPDMMLQHMSAMMEQMRHVQRQVEQVLTQQQPAAGPSTGGGNTAGPPVRARSPVMIDLTDGMPRTQPASHPAAPAPFSTAPEPFGDSTEPFAAAERGADAPSFASEFTNGKRNADAVGYELCSFYHYLHRTYYRYVDLMGQKTLGKQGEWLRSIGTEGVCYFRHEVDEHFRNLLQYHWRLFQVRDAPDWFDPKTGEGQARIESFALVFYRVRVLMAHMRAMEAGASVPTGCDPPSWSEILRCLTALTEKTFYGQGVPAGDHLQLAAIRQQYKMMVRGARPHFTDELQQQLDLQARHAMGRHVATATYAPPRPAAPATPVAPVAPRPTGPRNTPQTKPCKYCRSMEHTSNKHGARPVTEPCDNCGELHVMFGDHRTPCNQATAAKPLRKRARKEVRFVEEEQA